MNKPGEALILIMFLSVANYVSGDCLQVITEIDTLDNHSYVVKTRDYPRGPFVAIDTISRDRFLASLVVKHNAASICYVAQIDTVIRYTEEQASYWRYMDFVKVSVDRVIKGTTPLEMWFQDGPDPWYMCVSETMDICIGVTDDGYGHYSQFQHDNYLFFSPNTDNLRSSSVKPDGCRGNYGNRIDAGNFIWSDYPYGYPQCSVAFQDFQLAIQASEIRSNVKTYKVIDRSPTGSNTVLYDIRGRRISARSTSKMAVCVFPTASMKATIIINTSPLSRR
jgi:hypothetical protein